MITVSPQFLFSSFFQQKPPEPLPDAFTLLQPENG